MNGRMSVVLEQGCTVSAAVVKLNRAVCEGSCCDDKTIHKCA